MLIEEFKSDDIKKRINSINNLKMIATALGPERTKLELVPFLNELIDDEDEVLLTLIDNLSKNFIECIGGNNYA